MSAAALWAWATGLGIALAMLVMWVTLNAFEQSDHAKRHKNPKWARECGAICRWQVGHGPWLWRAEVYRPYMFCGILKEEDGSWLVHALGPNLSARETCASREYAALRGEELMIKAASKWLDDVMAD